MDKKSILYAYRRAILRKTASPVRSPSCKAPRLSMIRAPKWQNFSISKQAGTSTQGFKTPPTITSRQRSRHLKGERQACSRQAVRRQTFTPCLISQVAEITSSAVPQFTAARSTCCGYDEKDGHRLYVRIARLHGRRARSGVPPEYESVVRRNHRKPRACRCGH